MISRDIIIKFSFVTEILVPPEEAKDYQLDLFPQVHHEHEYEKGWEESDWKNHNDLPAVQNKTKKPKPTTIQNDDYCDTEEQDSPETTGMRSIRQFSSRFKTHLVHKNTL